MHVDGPGQEIARRSIVREALDGEGLSDVAIGAFYPSPDGLLTFRHVIKLGFGYSDQGHVRVGAWGRRDKSIVPIPRCEVAIPVLRSVMVALAHHTLGTHDDRPGHGGVTRLSFGVLSTGAEVDACVAALREV